MRNRRYRRYAAGLIPLAGLGLANGCMATVERNLDYLLAPDTLENTLFLPASTFAPWVLFFFVGHVI